MFCHRLGVNGENGWRWELNLMEKSSLIKCGVIPKGRKR